MVKIISPAFRKSPFFFPVILVTIYIVAVITSGITSDVRTNITNRFIEEGVMGCSESKSQGGLGLTGSELDFCEERARAASRFDAIKVSDCGLCGLNQNGEEGLCLKGEDLTFCEENVSQAEGIAQFGSSLQKISDPISNFTITQVAIGASILFVISFLARKR